MAETINMHVVVEIPVDEEHQQKIVSSISVMEQHPLMEISQSPGHLLLLKLYQREEKLFGRKIANKETRIDSVKREISQLGCFFFIFHSFFFTILFTSSMEQASDHGHVCKKWWIPSVLSMCFSLVVIFLVQAKTMIYWKLVRQLEKLRVDNRGVSRCITELRMKGASFDLSKEVLNGKRMKSSSVEIKWRPVTLFSRYLVTIVLVSFTGLIVPICRFMVCY